MCTMTPTHVTTYVRAGALVPPPSCMYHTGGFPSIPTVHPCPCEGSSPQCDHRQNQDATTDEPNNLHGTMQSHKKQFFELGLQPSAGPPCAEFRCFSHPCFCVCVYVFVYFCAFSACSWGRQGSRQMTPEKPKRALWVDLGREPRPQFHEKDSPERGKKNEVRGGRGEKNAKCWLLTTLWPPHRRTTFFFFFLFLVVMEIGCRISEFLGAPILWRFLVPSSGLLFYLFFPYLFVWGERRSFRFLFIFVAALQL